jgi:threonine/homoserine/homoserine lactone efflux protein
VLAATDWGAKLGFTILGVCIFALGIWFLRSGASITAALNRDYARLPFHFQYPTWWHRFIGALFAGFGLLLAITSIVFGFHPTAG